MKWELQGTVMQILNIELDPGEVITSESGKMMYITDNIRMETKPIGGIWASIKRVAARESFFLVEFTPEGGKGVVGIASEFPGKIIPLELKEGQEVICQKDGFLCSKDVEFDATFTKKIGAGFLGGEGLILIKLKGPGRVFMNMGGEVTKIDLEGGQKLRVDTGCLAAFDAGMDYSVERVKGITNIIWGGEGLFLATIKGPGRIWIQSMPIKDLAGKLAQYMPGREKALKLGAAGATASVLGTLLKKKKFKPW